MMIERHEIELLRRTFPTSAHSVRQGPSSSKGDKCMWFVFIDRFAIIDRLDELFPGEWEYYMTEPVDRGNHYSAVGTLTIRDIARSYNGGFEKKSKMADHDAEKSCGTDTFRRVASQWGIGSYLAKLADTNMWTAKPAKGDWDAEKKAKAEIMNRLGKWLNGQQAKSTEPPQQSNGSKEPPPPITKHKPWHPDDVEMVEDKIVARFPDSMRRLGEVKKHFKIKEWSELGSVEKASTMICTRLYEMCASVKPLEIRHTGKHLEVSVAPDLKLHPTIRIYDRRGVVQNEWLGEFAYVMLGWNNYDDKVTHGQWTEIGAEIAIHYERNEHGTLIATGIGHNFVDPQLAADQEVEY